MATPTGTVWDLALNPATPARPGDDPALSARAAYQLALIGRAVLVDVRPAAERAAQGRPHPGLRGHTMPLAALPEWLVGGGHGADVVLISSDGAEAGRAAAALDRLGLARPGYVRGGFAAWRAAGMPVTAPRR